MAHEESITVFSGRRNAWINLSTRFQGKTISPDEALNLHEAGKVQPLGAVIFGTMDEAINDAIRRSREFGRVRGDQLR
jgi:hypothetical protein